MNAPQRQVPQPRAQQSLFATCALPGCGNPVLSWGEACAGCGAAFGCYLRPTRPDQPLLTEEDLAQRDREVAHAHARQRVIAGAVTPQAANAAVDEAPERRRNQQCWLCDQRRTCRRMPQGWECNDCRAVI